MTVLPEIGAGRPGRAEPGLYLLNGTGVGTGIRRLTAASFEAPVPRKPGPWSTAFLLCSSRVASYPFLSADKKDSHCPLC